jgi:hypothetical protein
MSSTFLVDVYQHCSEILNRLQIIFRAYTLGIGFGIIILSTLILFPGTSFSSSQPIADRHNQHDPPTPEPAARYEKDNDDVSNEINSSISKLFKVTHSRRQRDWLASTWNDQAAFWSPYRILNTSVYIVVLLISALIINHSYGNILVLTARAYFPREMAVFG